MKHQGCAFLLFVGFLACADDDRYAIADKSQRIGRFSYEDSFDENLVETVLNSSSAVVKKNVRKLLYPDDDDVKQRLLLLGGTSNASTTAIAKAIAVRCGYEYYLVEASALLKECREGRQMLLSEIRPIIKQGKPIALIITELPEMADYSGLLASTLWLLIDQCAQYPDVFVIGTSALQKGQLSEEIKERFGGDIISVSLDKSMQDNIENVVVPKTSWLEKNKTACLVVGGLVGLALVAAHLYAQMLFAVAYAEREQEKMLLESKMVAAYEEILLVQKKGREIQDQQYAEQKQQYTKQDQQYAKQEQQFKKQEEQCTMQEKQWAMQKEQCRIQYSQYISQLMQLNLQDKSGRIQEVQYNAYFQNLSEARKQEINKYDETNKQIEQNMRKRLAELESASKTC